MGAWARCFRANRMVRVVKLVQNGIRQDGVWVLLEQGLGGCEGLRELDLQDNTFTILGARALAGVLPRWGGLRELGVGDCLLGRRGGEVVFRALRGCGGLEVLRAQYNEIDVGGVRVLLGVAKGLERLRKVEVNGNKFAEEDEGVEGLRALLDGRREAAGGEEGEGAWGLDELSDLEEDSEEDDGGEDEDEEANEEEEEREERREGMLKDAEEEEGMKVAEKKDEDVDALADALGKTHVK